MSEKIWPVGQNEIAPKEPYTIDSMLRMREATPPEQEELGAIDPSLEEAEAAIAAHTIPGQSVSCSGVVCHPFPGYDYGEAGKQLFPNNPEVW